MTLISPDTLIPLHRMSPRRSQFLWALSYLKEDVEHGGTAESAQRILTVLASIAKGDKIDFHSLGGGGARAGIEAGSEF